MNFISRVLIENFQSHTRSEFEFGPGLNVIIGPSDNGKSAVLRAIRWALYNEPRGTDFVRSGARECRVTVTMTSGAEIVRELLVTKSGGAARNRYIVKLPGGEPQVFEGFGSDVPAEVARAHSMAQVMLDTDKKVQLSFGSQLEGPFLMTESGSLRARAIGRLLGVHVVDAAVRNTQKDLRTVRLEVGRLEREVERYDTELKQYEDIPEQEARLEQAEAILARVDELNQRLQRLDAMRVELERAEREEIITSARLAELGELGAAEAALKQAEEAHRQCARLERLAADRQRMEEESRQYKVRIDALTALPIAEARAREAAERQSRLTGLTRIDGELKAREQELAQVGQRVARLEAVPRANDLLAGVAERLQRLQRLEERLAQVADIQQRLTKGQELLRQTNAELNGHLGEYESVLRQLGKCPTCMQPVAPGAVKRILAELAGEHTH